ncbi:MAG: hypothetical protein ACREOV_02925, partial [Candidatus Dormibacteraceae bacterium]
MQNEPSHRWYLSAPIRIALIVVALLAATVAAATLVPTALQALGFMFALLVGFAICALPFAMVLGIVWMITRAARPARPAMYTYPPGPGLQGQRSSAPYPRAPRPPGPPHGRLDPTSELPPRLQAIAARIHDKAAALRSPSQWGLLSPEDQMHVDRITGEYLPAIVKTFRSIPRGTQDWPVREDGPSAVDLVEHQLTLLERGLDAIADRVFKAGAAQLLAQQQAQQQATQTPT